MRVALTTIRERRQHWMKRLRSPDEREEVIAYLKGLKGIPQDQPLPSGTAIVAEILRLEDARAAATALPSWEPAGYRGRVQLYN